MTSIKYLAVGMIVSAVTATINQYSLSNGFSVDFDPQTCALTINKDSSVLWQSDNKFLSSGDGTVDQVTIMQAGNIVNFP